MIYHKRHRYYCARCSIIIPEPGLCPDCAAGEAWIAYCKDEGDERFWLRRTELPFDPDQTPLQERRAQDAREKKRHKKLTLAI